MDAIKTFDDESFEVLVRAIFARLDTLADTRAHSVLSAITTHALAHLLPDDADDWYSYYYYEPMALGGLYLGDIKGVETFLQGKIPHNHIETIAEHWRILHYKTAVAVLALLYPDEGQSLIWLKQIKCSLIPFIQQGVKAELNLRFRTVYGEGQYFIDLDKYW
ncbi:MAG: hypothetical protein D6712_21050 [Chloroflexi bacterium]|nr:MAG: hypothetical protein D6712_21050 [Chloroflexota bacterium]